MKKKVVTFILCLILVLVLPLTSISSAEDSGPQLGLRIWSGFPIDLGVHNIGGTVKNIGDEIVRQISVTYTITGGYDNSINYTFTEFIGDLPPTWSHIIDIPDLRGFGLITITITATSLNADNVTKTRKGLQLGPVSVVPFYLTEHFIEMFFVSLPPYFPKNN